MFTAKGLERGELTLPTFADRLRQRLVRREVNEEQEGFSRSPFFSHEQHRDVWRQQQNGHGGRELPRVRQLCDPFAKTAIADLVVILQKVDEGERGQVARAFATRPARAILR